MRVPKFDRNDAHWDTFHDWHTFPTAHGQIVQFHTGEVIFVPSKWEPGRRHWYEELRIHVVSTADDKCPKLYLPGTDQIVPSSALNQGGQQILVIDPDFEIAVGFCENYGVSDAVREFDKRNYLERIPVRFRGTTMTYCYGDDTPIIGGCVHSTKPTKYTKEQTDHMALLVGACQTWVKMTEESNSGALLNARNQAFQHPSRYGLSKQEAITATLKDLSPADRWMVSTKGLEADYTTELYTHFKVKAGLDK